jgi:hypothetical protein
MTTEAGSEDLDTVTENFSSLSTTHNKCNMVSSNRVPEGQRFLGERSRSEACPDLLSSEFTARIHQNLESMISSLAASSSFQTCEHTQWSPSFRFCEAFEEDEDQLVASKEEGRTAAKVAASAVRMAAGAKTTGERASSLARKNQVPDVPNHPAACSISSSTQHKHAALLC